MRRAADDQRLLWMVNLASMTRMSILSFAIAGAALSMAFYDYFMAVLVLTAVLRQRLEAKVEAGNVATEASGVRMNKFRRHAAMPAAR
jgi:hypothetical protein